MFFWVCVEINWRLDFETPAIEYMELVRRVGLGVSRHFDIVGFGTWLSLSSMMISVSMCA